MKIKRLTKAAIATLQDGMHNDGNGLYLRIRGTSKCWILRFRWNWTRHDLGLGTLEEVSLADARAKADRIRVGIKEGRHPILSKQQETNARKSDAALAKGTSIQLASFYVEALNEYAQSNKLRNADFEKAAVSFCKKYLLPTLDMPVASVTKENISQTLMPLWNSYRGKFGIYYLRILFRYALRHGYVKEPLPTVWEGGLDSYLPRNKDKVKHFAFAPWKEIPDWFARIYKERNDMARYVCFVMLTACRRSEAANATIDMFDLKNRTFTLPMNKTHEEPVVFPYPKQAAKLLRVAPGQTYMFEYKSRSGFKPINHRLVSLWLNNDIGYKATVHGFRSSFSTWCADNGKDYEVREKVLTHAGDAVVESYQRSELIERRRALLQEWADFVCSKTKL